MATLNSDRARVYLGDRGLRGCVLALLAICMVCFWIRTEHIAGTLPYPQHVDEAIIANAAGDIMRYGDWHPGTFNYPSLPKYLAVAAMSVGFVFAAPELEFNKQRGIDIKDDLGDVSVPFYTLPGVVEKARWLFALLSVVAVAMSGVVAYQLLNRPTVLILGPLVLALSYDFFDMSKSYLNVDIVGACFVMLGIAAALQGTRCPSSSLRWRAVIPAICAGLAAGSKYTYGLLLVPVLLAIYLFMEHGRWLGATTIALATAGLSFLAVNPYSVIDLPTFLNGLATDVYVYATGHAGHEGNPGLDQLASYVSDLAWDFGVPGLILCLLGLIYAVVSDWRRTLVLLSFPVALLALLSAQKAHFLRNIIPVFPCVAVLIACGIYFLHGCLMRVPWIRRIEVRGLQSAIGVVGFLGIFALGLNLPLINFANLQMEFAGETRVQAVAWIKKHVATDTTVIIPAELYLDSRPLASSGYPIRIAEFKSLDTAQRIDSLMAEIPGPVVVLVPKWSRAKAKEAALNEAAMQAQLVPLVDFGFYGLKINDYYGGGVPGGHPGFSIARRVAAEHVNTNGGSSFEAKRHRAQRQRYVQQLIEQAGEPVIHADSTWPISTWGVERTDEQVARAGWDVYRNGRKLTYRKQPCAPDDGQTNFVLQVSPNDPADLPADRQQHGFDHLDFYFHMHGGIRLDDQCVVTAQLPDYPISRIHIGRWIDGNHRMLWEMKAKPFAGERHRAQRQRYVQQLIEQADEQVARAGWSVYRTGRQLLYRKEPCVPADVQAKIVLHVIPTDPNVLSIARQQHGYDSLGFYFDQRGFQLDDQCIAIAHLPDYAIDRIRVGQWIAKEDRTVWEAEFSASR